MLSLGIIFGLLTQLSQLILHAYQESYHSDAGVQTVPVLLWSLFSARPVDTAAFLVRNGLGLPSDEP